MQCDDSTQHELEIRLKLHIDDAEIGPGDTPRDTAERWLRTILSVEDTMLDVRVCSWTWTSNPTSRRRG
jgi:hypothetical protein